MASRRVVTGVNSAGASCLDVELSCSKEQNEAGVTEMWGSAAVPADNSSGADLASEPYAHDPGPGGVKFRTVEIPAHTAGSELLVASPTMDLVLVLSGSIVLELAAESVQLEQGDCAVLRGHPHRWVNRSDAAAVIGGALLDATSGEGG